MGTNTYKFSTVAEDKTSVNPDSVTMHSMSEVAKNIHTCLRDKAIVGVVIFDGPDAVAVRTWDKNDTLSPEHSIVFDPDSSSGLLQYDIGERVPGSETLSIAGLKQDLGEAGVPKNYSSASPLGELDPKGELSEHLTHNESKEILRGVDPTRLAEIARSAQYRADSLNPQSFNQ